jgi:hypothetical protein
MPCMQLYALILIVMNLLDIINYQRVSLFQIYLNSPSVSSCCINGHKILVEVKDYTAAVIAVV